MNPLLCALSPGCYAETTRSCCVTATRDEPIIPTSGTFQVVTSMRENRSAETLLRELAEELGITVDPPTAPAWMTLAVDGLELSIFLIDHWEGEPHNVSPDEHDDIGWVSIDDLSQLDFAHPSYVELLREALK